MRRYAMLQVAVDDAVDLYLFALTGDPCYQRTIASDNHSDRNATRGGFVELFDDFLVCDRVDFA